MHDVAEILKTITPGAYGIWTLVIMLAGYLVKEWKDSRKLSVEERQAKREGWTRQLELVMNENRMLLRDLHDLRVEYDAHRKLCHAEQEQMRRMLIELETEVQGLKRRVATDALEIVKLKGGLDE